MKYWVMDKIPNINNQVVFFLLLFIIKSDKVIPAIVEIKIF